MLQQHPTYILMYLNLYVHVCSHVCFYMCLSVAVCSPLYPWHAAQPWLWNTKCSGLKKGRKVQNHCDFLQEYPLTVTILDTGLKSILNPSGQLSGLFYYVLSSLLSRCLKKGLSDSEVIFKVHLLKAHSSWCTLGIPPRHQPRAQLCLECHTLLFKYFWIMASCWKKKCSEA